MHIYGNTNYENIMYAYNGIYGTLEHKSFVKMISLIIKSESNMQIKMATLQILHNKQIGNYIILIQISYTIILKSLAKYLIKL